MGEDMSTLTVIDGGKSDGGPVLRINHSPKPEPKQKDEDNGDNRLFRVRVRVRWFWFMVTIAEYELRASAVKHLFYFDKDTGFSYVSGIEEKSGKAIYIVPNLTPHFLEIRDVTPEV